MNSWEAEFTAALEAKNESGVIDMLKSGFPPNYMIRLRDTNGNYLPEHTYPLTIAIELELVEVIRWLLIAGVQSNVVDSYGRSPILVASAVGNQEIIQLLVAHRSNLAARDYYGNTILHIAAANAHIHLVKYFIEELRVHYSLRNKKGQTALDLCKEKQEQSKSLEEIEFLQSVIEYLWKVQENYKKKQRHRIQKNAMSPDPIKNQRECRNKQHGISLEHATSIPIVPTDSKLEILVSPYKQKRSIETYLKAKQNFIYKSLTAKKKTENEQFNLSRYRSPALTEPKNSSPTRFPPIYKTSYHC
ncbi:unnamed protein product [Blepharisma stoltei]|uniref:Uncharacterized protein n=1 Tax=Blepharisma stoltei TaxID=1481888 RepID=A0AAU9K2W6_9CILI|nr:unnamed protein product [Blepharisma stoltei]